MQELEGQNGLWEYNSDETFAFLNMLSILSKTDEFRKWLINFHNLKDHDQFFEGYKCLVLTALRGFINSILMNDPFKLRDDELFTIANSRGFNIEKLPNSCEKVVFLKNVWRLSKSIRKPKSWKDLNVKEALAPLLKSYEVILKQNLKATKNTSKLDSLTFATEFCAYLFLIDTRKARPHGYYVSILNNDLNLQYLDKIFTGYAYSLQFLWYKLLGSERFQKSCVKDLHRSQKVRFEHDKKTLTINIGTANSERVIEETLEEKRERKFRKSVFEKWLSIDQFFEEIRSEIIQPLEKKLDHGLGSLGKGLLQIEKFRKSNLGSLLKKDSTMEPAFVKKKDDDSIKKQLDVKFLWEDLDILDAGQASWEFNGVFAFISMLTGYVKILHDHDSEGVVKVMIIKHPSDDESHYYYSFAILVASYGIFAHDSGWIVFFDCAMDSSGSGVELRDSCLNTIEKFRKDNSISVEELIVDKKLFKEFLDSRGVSYSKHTETSTLYREANEIVSQAKGKLFEYIFFKYWFDNKKHKIIRCDFSLNDEQIDCIAVDERTVIVFECKLQLHEIQKTIKQIQKKIAAVKRKYHNYQVIPCLITYEPIMYERQKEIKSKGISIIQNFKNILQNDRVFDGERKKLLRIFDSDLRERYYYGETSWWRPRNYWV